HFGDHSPFAIHRFTANVMAHSSRHQARFWVGLVIATMLHTQRLKDEGLHQFRKRGVRGIHQELLEHGVVTPRVAELTARKKRDTHGWRIGGWMSVEHLPQRGGGGAAPEATIPILRQPGRVSE